MITVQQLRKSYGDRVAVENVSFRVETGRTLGLLGPNGAGKSTTISLLLGVLSPDSGEVCYGPDAVPAEEFRQRIGVVPQSLALYEDLTARENLNLFAALYSLSATQTRDRVAWCLEFVGLQDRADDRVASYSGGMKRRLNLAIALVHEPEVLLLDEPTVGVDPQSRNHLFEGIEALQKQGLTLIYTTHYMEEAQRLCDEVAVIDGGRLLALDTVEALLQTHGGASVIHADLTAPPPQDLPGVLDDLHWRCETADPIGELAACRNQGVEFHRVRIESSDLESVFLKLTGRTLRD